MTSKEFRKKCESTFHHKAGSKNEMLMYIALAINEEAGEVAGELKKMMRDDGGKMTPERFENILEETGDVVYYVAMLLSQFDLDIGHVYDRASKKLDEKIEEFERKTGKEFTPDLYIMWKRSKNKK